MNSALPKQFLMQRFPQPIQLVGNADHQVGQRGPIEGQSRLLEDGFLSVEATEPNWYFEQATCAELGTGIAAFLDQRFGARRRHEFLAVPANVFLADMPNDFVLSGDDSHLFGDFLTNHHYVAVATWTESARVRSVRCFSRKIG